MRTNKNKLNKHLRCHILNGTDGDLETSLWNGSAETFPNPMQNPADSSRNELRAQAKRKRGDVERDVSGYTKTQKTASRYSGKMWHRAGQGSGDSQENH